jgi:branched-chain amino acid aminotransferase
VLSHSHQRGSLVFDYLGAHATPRGPAVFRLDDHVRRFFASIEMVGLPLRQDAAARDPRRAANPGAKSIKSAPTCVGRGRRRAGRQHVTLCVAAYDPVADILRPKR